MLARKRGNGGADGFWGDMGRHGTVKLGKKLGRSWKMIFALDECPHLSGDTAICFYLFL